MSVAQRLRQKLLDLAIHGKLVPQCAKDEPAGELLARIRKARNAGGGRTQTSAAPLPIPEEEIPFDLPRGWVWSRLGEIGIWGAGATPSRKNPKYYEGGKIPWLKTGDLNDGLVMHIPECITQDALAETSVRLNPIGSVLIAMYGATIGKVGILGVEATTNQACCVCQPEGAVDNQFLFYYLMSQREQFKRLGGGGAQPNISKELIVSYPIPLPPLAEQKRIVEKLNAMLKEATRVAEGTERLALLRKKARAKILDLAIRGKLVTQEKSDEPAAELLKRIATEKAKLVAEKKIKKEKPLPPIADDEIPFELPKGWAWARWGDLSLSIQYGYNAPAKTAGRIKMVRITDIQNGKIIWDGVPYCEIPDMDIECYELKIGDILFARTGGTVGKSHLVADVPTPAVYAGYLIRTRCSSLLNPEYFKYFMESTLYWSQLRKGTIATAQPNCNGQTLSKMIVPLPPLAEQQRIVAKVKEMLAACDAFGGEG